MRLTITACVIAVCVLIAAPFANQYVFGAKDATELPRPMLSFREVPRLYAPGVVEGACREIELVFEMRGRLEAILVAEGDVVRQGDVLARLDSEMCEHSVAQAKAQLRLAQAEKLKLVNGARRESLDVARADVKIAAVRVDHSKRSLQRTANLTRGGGIAEQELDNQTAARDQAIAEHNAACARANELAAPARSDELEIADAKIALAEAQLRQAEKSLSLCVLRAPRDGTIAEISAEPGELLEPSAPKPLLTLVGTERLLVRAYVDELDALRVKPGMIACAVADGMPTSQFRGHIQSCATVMVHKKDITNSPAERRDVKVREVVVALDLEHGQNSLVIGLPVEVSFEELSGGGDK